MIDDLTEKPFAMIDYRHHSYRLNSAAMKLKNITKDTPDIADEIHGSAFLFWRRLRQH